MPEVDSQFDDTPELDDEPRNRIALPSKRLVQEIRARLMPLLRHPGQTGEVLANLRGDPQRVLGIDAAIIGVPDEATRHNLARLVCAADDRHVTSFLRGLAPVYLATVGVYFEGEAPEQQAGRTVGPLLSGTLDGLIQCDFRDPLRPDAPTLILAGAAHDVRLASTLSLATTLTLGDPTVPSLAEFTAEWDPSAEGSGYTPAVFIFAISPQDYADGKFSGTHYERCLSVVHSRLAAFAAAHPKAHAVALPAAPFWSAVQHVQEASLGVAVTREFQSIQAVLNAAKERAALDELPEDVARSSRLNTAQVTLTTWADELVQTADILLTGTDPQALAHLVRHRVSLLSTLDSVVKAVTPACQALGLRVQTLPAAASPGPWEPLTNEQLLRDIDGQWRTVGLAALPYEARSLLNVAHWRKTLIADSLDQLKEMAQWPYPFLSKNADLPGQLQSHYRPDVARAVLAASARPGLSFTQALRELTGAFPALAFLQAVTSVMHEADLPYDLYLAQHFRKCNGRVFHIKHALVERLDFTDIEQGVPVASLRAPYEDCYFHLERPWVLRQDDPMTKEARVVGYFVTQQERVAPDTGWRLALAPVLTVGDDVLTSYSQEIELELTSQDPRGLLEAVNDLVSRNPHAKRLASEDERYQIYSLCAKVLLYLGLRSARLVSKPQRTRLLEQANGKPPAERKRLTHLAAQTYDFIEVGPERTMEQEHAATTHEGSSRVYWRRGFFRMQAYGPQWSLHRQRWIQPTLVNAELLSRPQDAPPVRDYMVGGSQQVH